MTKSLSVVQASKLLHISVPAIFYFLNRKRFFAAKKTSEPNSAFVIDAASFEDFLRERVAEFKKEASKYEGFIKDLQKEGN